MHCVVFGGMLKALTASAIIPDNYLWLFARDHSVSLESDAHINLPLFPF